MRKSTRRTAYFALAVVVGFGTALSTAPAAADLLATINANNFYTAFDLTGRTQEASHASFSLEFPGSGVALQSELIPFAGPFPITTVFDSSDPGFAGMAALLTDDVNESLRKGLQLWLPNGQSQPPKAGGGSALESIIIPLRPNLLDARVTLLEFVVGHMDHQVEGTNERLAINARWLIHGVPVPEPAASWLVMGVLLLIRKRTRRAAIVLPPHVFGLLRN